MAFSKTLLTLYSLYLIQDSKITIDKAQNGKYYLPKGAYTLKMDDQSTELEIK